MQFNWTTWRDSQTGNERSFVTNWWMSVEFKFDGAHDSIVQMDPIFGINSPLVLASVLTMNHTQKFNISIWNLPWPVFRFCFFLFGNGWRELTVPMSNRYLISPCLAIILSTLLVSINGNFPTIFFFSFFSNSFWFFAFVYGKRITKKNNFFSQRSKLNWYRCVCVCSCVFCSFRAKRVFLHQIFCCCCFYKM